MQKISKPLKSLYLDHIYSMRCQNGSQNTYWLCLLFQMERKPITRFKKEIKLNEMAERKEPNYPAYNIAKDDDEHYRIEVALAGFCINDISLETEKGMLKIEANKKDERSNYIHQGIAQRGFSKVFRLAEHIKIDDARFVDGILTIALRREIPEADRPQKIEINNGPKKIAKAA